MAYRRMYIPGGLASVAGHEGFGLDYILPNNGYLETCAGVDAGFFHRNMSLAPGDARYVDELERVLYNAVLPGWALQGNTHFYENPLEAQSQRPVGSGMVALPGYIYAQDAKALYVNLFVGSRVAVSVKGSEVTFHQATRYAWDVAIICSVTIKEPTDFTLCLRLPVWCVDPQVKVNGQLLSVIEKVRGNMHAINKIRVPLLRSSLLSNVRGFGKNGTTLPDLRRDSNPRQVVVSI